MKMENVTTHPNDPGVSGRGSGPVFHIFSQTKCLPVHISPSFPTSLFASHTCLSLCLFDWLAVCLTWCFLLVPVSFLFPVCLSGPWRPVRPVLLSVDVQFKSGLTFPPDLFMPFLFLVKFGESSTKLFLWSCSGSSRFSLGLCSRCESMWFYSHVFHWIKSWFVAFCCTGSKTCSSYCQSVSVTFDLLLLKPGTWRLKLFVFSRWLQIALKESVSKGNED